MGFAYFLFAWFMFSVYILPPVRVIVFAALFFAFRRICRKHREKFPDKLYLGWRWNCMLACGFLAGLNLVLTIGNFLSWRLSRP